MTIRTKATLHRASFLATVLPFVMALALAFVQANGAHAGDTVLRGAAPAWVKPFTAPAAEPETSDGSAFRIDLMEQQFRLDPEGWRVFVRTRMTVEDPAALAAFGTIALPWNPASQTITVHEVNLIRGGRTINALEGHEFTVLRREQNLEDALLTGVLTGTLQLDDVRVGDTVEVAYSTVTHIPVLGAHAEYLTTAALPARVGRVRVRGSWPTALGVRIRTTDGLDQPVVRRRGADSEFEFELTDLEPLIVPDDAPRRFQHVRQLEATDYRSWGELAAVFAPLYDKASTLEPDSPVRARIEEIRTTHDTQAARVEAALRLVQDEVRYLALSMGEGGLIPATADETWRRRLGDCKAKTALLLAILRELGVTARPVLVSTEDDALDRRLPMVSPFDHVIVQAEVDGGIAWLDGTRSGDREVANLVQPDYGWVLPVTASGAELVKIEPRPLARPRREMNLAIDASRGIYSASPVTGEWIHRGDAATEYQALFATAAAAQRDAHMRATWEGLLPALKVSEVRSAYDREKNEFRFLLKGTLVLDWTSQGTRRLEIPVSRISWSAGERRPEGPYRDVPLAIGHPGYSRFQTVVTLPPEAGFTLEGEDVAVEAAGYAHWRKTRIEGNVATMERETRTLVPEIPETVRAASEEPLRVLGRQRALIVASSDYAASAADVEAWDESKPETAEALETRARMLSENRRYDEAIEAFDKAVALEPRRASAWSGRGIVRFWTGDSESARADFEKAAELDPSDRVAMNGRALMAMRDGNYQDAVLELSRSLRQAPDEQFALNLRAQAYVMLKEYDKALIDTRRAQTLRPDNVSLALQEVSVLRAAGRLEEAQTRIDSLVEENPSSLESLRLQATLRETREDYAGAEAALTAALAIESDHPLLRLNRASVRALLGNLDGAREDIVVARAGGSESPVILNNLCWAQASAGFDLDRAMEDCDAALALRPDNPAYLDSRALVLLWQDRFDEALATYDKALGQAPDQMSSVYGRGLALKGLGRSEEGETERARALAKDPKVGEGYRSYEARSGSAAAGQGASATGVRR